MFHYDINMVFYVKSKFNHNFFFFFQRNETVWGEGEYNMFTGEDDYKKTGKIHTWDNKTRTHYQGHCGEIRGSANGFFPPFLEKNNTLELFSHEACRYDIIRFETNKVRSSP